MKSIYKEDFLEIVLQARVLPLPRFSGISSVIKSSIRSCDPSVTTVNEVKALNIWLAFDIHSFPGAPRIFCSIKRATANHPPDFTRNKIRMRNSSYAHYRESVN